MASHHEGFHPAGSPEEYSPTTADEMLTDDVELTGEEEVSPPPQGQTSAFEGTAETAQTKAQIPQGTAHSASSQEYLVLLKVSRDPKEFHEALETCAELQNCREELVSAGKHFQLPSGAKVFVRPEQYDVALKEAELRQELKPQHVLVSQDYEELVTKVIKRLPCNSKVRVQTKVKIPTEPDTNLSESTASQTSRMTYLQRPRQTVMGDPRRGTNADPLVLESSSGSQKSCLKREEPCSKGTGPEQSGPPAPPAPGSFNASSFQQAAELPPAPGSRSGRGKWEGLSDEVMVTLAARSQALVASFGQGPAVRSELGFLESGLQDEVYFILEEHAPGGWHPLPPRSQIFTGDVEPEVRKAALELMFLAKAGAGLPPTDEEREAFLSTLSERA